MGLNLMMAVLIREENGGKTLGEGDMTMEAEISVLHLRAKGQAA
jgi:hypothetical protein